MKNDDWLFIIGVILLLYWFCYVLTGDARKAWVKLISYFGTITFLLAGMRYIDPYQYWDIFGIAYASIIFIVVVFW